MTSLADNPGVLNYRLLRIAHERYGREPGALDQEQHKQVRSIATNEILLEQAVLTSPEASRVSVSDTEIGHAVERISARYPDADAFRRSLESNELDTYTLRLALERELRVDAIMTLVGEQAKPVDDTEVRLYYYLHPEKFQRDESRIARHILITINPHFPENTREEATRRLGMIARRVRRHPDRFAEQATKHSECPTSLEGGMLGNLRPGTLFPELDTVLFNMEEGRISDIIESEVGLHLLYCEKVERAGTVPLKQVEAQLREKLVDRNRRVHQRSWVKSLLDTVSSTNGSASQAGTRKKVMQ